MNSWREYFVDLAHYHSWANDIMFSALDKLTEEQRKQDCGLFFHSIHHTVDHLLLVNQFWIGRLTGKPIAADFKTIRIQDWGGLKTALRQHLIDMAAWLEKQDEAWFAGDVTFTASSGKVTTMPVVSALTHMLTHFNHHRGQVSAAITRLGGVAPEMDYVYYLRARAG